MRMAVAAMFRGELKRDLLVVGIVLLIVVVVMVVQILWDRTR